jgi:MFS family permease
MSSTARAARPDVRTGSGTLAVTSASTFLMLVVFTLPLTTITGTAAELAAGPGAQAWILSGMPVGAAAGLLAAGALGDDRGRRRVFVLGALVLAAASVLAALASTATVLVVARVVQGLGGAALIACGLGLIGQAYLDSAARARATAVWGAALGAGVAAGPVLAAVLAGWGGWRLPYAATAAAAALLAVAGLRVLAESRAEQPRALDLVGTVTLGLGTATLLGGLIEGRSGWTQPLTLLLLAGGIVLMAAFVLVEHRSRRPMLDLGLFRHADFVGATVGALASGASILALSNVVPVVVDRGLGAGGLLSSVVLLAWSATSAVTALAARWLPQSWTPRAQLVTGLVVVGVGQLAMLGITPGDSPARLLPGLFLAGAANGLLNAALGRQAVASVPADRSAMGSGANNTARYLGSAIGIAACSVIVNHAGADAGPAGITSGWNAAVAMTAAISLIGALVVAIVRDRPTPAG